MSKAWNIERDKLDRVDLLKRDPLYVDFLPKYTPI